MQIRKATKDDALYLAELINLAGEGIPFYLWEQMKADEQTVLEFGAQRASREKGGFSYSSAWVTEQGDQVAAMILGYKQPDPYDLDDLDENPDFIRPIVELEAMAPGSWYVNALATFGDFRKKGLGRRLLFRAEEIAREEGCSELSLIVSTENPNARRLYEKLGYNSRASKPIIQFSGFEQSGDWVLMVKPI